MLYIRNTLGTAYVDPYIGLEIPAKVTTNEGIFAIDSNNLESLLREGSHLSLLFRNGVDDNSVPYGSSGLYVSGDASAGEGKGDIGAAGATDQAKATIAYQKVKELAGEYIYYDGAGTNYLESDVDVQSAITTLDTQVATLSGVSDTLTWRPNVEFITEDTTFNVAGPITIADITTPMSDDEAPVSYNVPAVNTVITDGDLAAAIAANIRLETFPGWVVTGTGADVIFTSTIYGPLAGTNSFTLNTTTGVIGDFVITTSGSNGVSEEITLTVAGTAATTGSVDITLRNTPLATGLANGKYCLYDGATPSLWKSNGTTLTKQTGANGLVDGYAWVVKNDFVDTPASAENQSLWVYQTVDGLVKISDVDWGEISLQEAYDGGNTITVVNGRPFTVSPNGITVALATGTTTTKIGQTGGVTVTDTGTASAATLTFKDGNLTSAIPISQSGVTGLVAFSTGTSVVGALNEAKSVADGAASAVSSLSGTVSSHTTQLALYDDVTDGASGADNIGVTTITGLSGNTVQAVLESIAGKTNFASGKTYANIGAFTTAKAVSGDMPFVAGEVVYIQDTNRFVEVITVTDNITEDTDWSYVGGANNKIAGTLQVDATSVQLTNTAALVLPNNTTTNAVAGAIKFNATTGLTYVYTGSEWLSVSRQNVQYGATSTDGQYLTIGGVSSGQTGWLATRNCKIKAIAVKIGSGNLTKDFEVRKDGTIVGTAFTPTAGVISSTALDLSVTAGEYVQIFSSATGQKSDNVVAVIELAYVG